LPAIGERGIGRDRVHRLPREITEHTELLHRYDVLHDRLDTNSISAGSESPTALPYSPFFHASIIRSGAEFL
jgi:hypothetical protein